MAHLARLERSQWTVFYLFLCVFASRLALFLISDDNNGDALARVAMAKNIYNHHTWLLAGVWLPLHFYLIAAALAIYNDPLLMPRLLSMLSGTLVIFPYYYLIKREFDARTAILSVFFLASYILYIRYSLTSYAESPAIFFVVSALFFFFSYLDDPNRRLRCVLYASASLAAACMVRPEGWLLVGPLGIMMLWHERRAGAGMIQTLSRICIFISIPACCIGLWLLGNNLVLGDAWYSFTWGPRVFPSSNKPFYESWSTAAFLVPKALSWLSISFWAMGPIMAVLGIIGIGQAVSGRVHLWFLLIPGIFWSALITQTLFGKVHVQPRYSLFYSVLLIPFAAFALRSLVTIVRHNLRPYLAGILILLAMLGNAGSYYASRVAGRFQKPPIPIWSYGLLDIRLRDAVPAPVKITAQWLKTHLHDKDKLLIDYAPFSNYIFLYAGLDDLTQFNGSTADFCKDIDSLYRASRILSYKPEEYTGPADARKKIETYIETYKPRYVLYHVVGQLHNVFEFDRSCETRTWHQFRFVCRFENYGYHIYEILYP